MSEHTKTTVAIPLLLPCLDALGTLGEHHDLPIKLSVQISRLQVAIWEYVRPYQDKWNRLVEEYGQGGTVSRFHGREQRENPHWPAWVAKRDELLATEAELDVEPLCLCDFVKAGINPKPKTLTPLLAVGLITIPEGGIDAAE